MLQSEHAPAKSWDAQFAPKLASMLTGKYSTALMQRPTRLKEFFE